MEQCRELERHHGVVWFVVRSGGAGPDARLAVIPFLRLGSSMMSALPLSVPGSIHLHHAVHPLDAPPEQKLFHAELGRMALTPRVKVALFILQGYLGIMVLLVGWRLIAGT